MNITVQSTAFDDNARIPDRYSRDGNDVSPPLSWSGLPEGTKEVALVCEDPDAPTPKPFVHWLLRDIPADGGGLQEGDATGIPGKNDWGETAYGGPQPPEGHGMHRYFFRVYALDQELDLKEGFSREELSKAMQGHVLAEGQLIGTFERGAAKGAEG